MSTAEHWDEVWEGRDAELVTWYQAEPVRSVALITAVSAPPDPVVDVGGGASTLVDHLLDRGYGDVTVVDIAASSLATSRARLGHRASLVTWLVSDALDVDLGRQMTVWHDRAVFHFLVEPSDRARYLDRVRAALGIGGHVVMATFGPNGPETCSGLPTCRYDAPGLAAEFGDDFALVETQIEQHVSPAGTSQEFLYVVLQRMQ